MLPIILASSSRYRRQLIEKIGIKSKSVSPDIDETPAPGESASALVERLSTAKARSLAQRFPAHLIIGSDQTAELDGQLLGKPGSHQQAFRQLRAASGKRLHFHTGVALLNSDTGQCQYRCSRYEVHFRPLTDQQIEFYLQREQPYDCAGSFKSEGLGIALFTAIRGDDPNSLVGLPLIELTHMLLQEGIDVLRADCLH